MAGQVATLSEPITPDSRKVTVVESYNARDLSRAFLIATIQAVRQTYG